jgi:hypothetical protein
VRSVDRLNARSRAPIRPEGAQIADTFHMRCSRLHDTIFCLSQRGVTVQVVFGNLGRPVTSADRMTLLVLDLPPWLSAVPDQALLAVP